jgi:hypothetical protein
LWLPEGDCVLFNAFDRRVSGRCPRLVGEIVEQLESGMAFDHVTHQCGVRSTDAESLRAMLAYISGESDVKPFEAAIPAGRFTKLVLCPTADCNLRCSYC